jgi:hypothetical protein
MNKDILHVVSKVEQVRVVLDTMMTMNDEQEKNLKLLQKKNVETNANDQQLITYDLYKKMVMKQDETIAELLVE